MGNQVTRPANGPENSWISQNDKLILDLKLLKENLCKTEKRLVVEIDHLRGLALKLHTTGQPRSSVLNMLKLKKLRENNLETVYNQTNLVDSFISKIETLGIAEQVTNVVSKTHQLIKELTSKIDLNELDNIMDDMAEMQQFNQNFASRFKVYISEDEMVDLEAEIKKLDSSQLAPTAIQQVKTNPDIERGINENHTSPIIGTTLSNEQTTNNISLKAHKSAVQSNYSDLLPKVPEQAIQYDSIPKVPEQTVQSDTTINPL